MLSVMSSPADHQQAWNLARGIVGALTGGWEDEFAARWTVDFILASQPRHRSHHAIAAVRANDLDLCGIFQRMVGQSSFSAMAGFATRLRRKCGPPAAVEFQNAGH